MRDDSNTPIYRNSAYAVIRERQQRFGSIAVPKRYVCEICSPAPERGRRTATIPVERMARIASTGVVAGVVDCVCQACALANAKELVDFVRIVCIGCKEVVAQVEPEVEKSGFVWRRGGFYHVATCPTCTNDPRLRKSDLLEKICFYNARGIPYE